MARGRGFLQRGRGRRLIGTCARPLALEIVPVPRRPHGFGFDPRALVIVRDVVLDARRMSTLLRAAYGLTAAEADVALQLLDGHSPETIAATRDVSVGTVRAQIRAVYAKLDVHSVRELAALLNRLR